MPLRVLRWRREKQSREHLITRGGHTETPGRRRGWGDERQAALASIWHRLCDHTGGWLWKSRLIAT